MAEAHPLLEARQLTKTFGHVEALGGADFTVRPNEVVALIGDNGAGKSTLVKTLSGAIRPDGGQILMDGEEVEFLTPIDARKRGIETVYQDLALAPDLNPSDNLHLGREVLRPGLLGKLGFLDEEAMRAKTVEALSLLEVKLRSIHEPIASLSGGQRQGVAVGRAVAWASRVVFMDEPTAALGVSQTRSVLNTIRRVKASGRSVVLISHNMPEVFEVSDRIEVLRLGRRVASYQTADVTIEEVIGAMTGALAETGPWA